MIEGRCSCGRLYFLEPQGDRGLCCICERDARMTVALGVNWRKLISGTSEGRDGDA